ncbi:MAG: hypothetical protein CM15mP4_3880 [Candidatus Neomarinimicrobiota bacterium]|nr:MAG: hypothetical protein CM15mP4_3880 [Candidatus Neomarinimicrobiota bacterium]
MNHDFDWLSPIEDFFHHQPFRFRFWVDRTLGEEIENVLTNLPQRDSGKTNILNLNAHNQFKIGSNFH